MPASIDSTQFLQNLQHEAQQKMLRAITRAVHEFSAIVLAEAVTLCPVKTGALKASQQQEEVEVRGDLVTDEIGFNIFYATYVHEILTNKHPQGEVKFLEKALKANASKFMEHVQAVIQEEFGT